MELERAVGELGAVGGMLSADGYYLLGHKRFDPIYATAQRLGVPLGVHAAGTDMGNAGGEPFPKFIQAHTCSHALAQMRQFTSMMFDGVPVRFPELTLAFLEAGSGWVPYFLQRMDEEWEKRGHAEAKLLTKSPTDYVRGGRIYFSCEADEPLLPQALQWVGDERIFYASDFPHWDHSYPKSVKELADRADLTDVQKRRILADNARPLLHAGVGSTSRGRALATMARSLAAPAPSRNRWTDRTTCRSGLLIRSARLRST